MYITTYQNTSSSTIPYYLLSVAHRTESYISPISHLPSPISHRTIDNRQSTIDNRHQNSPIPPQPHRMHTLAWWLVQWRSPSLARGRPPAKPQDNMYHVPCTMKTWRHGACGEYGKGVHSSWNSNRIQTRKPKNRKTLPKNRYGVQGAEETSGFFGEGARLGQAGQVGCLGRPDVNAAGELHELRSRGV